jgi:hypothetical protein
MWVFWRFGVWGDESLEQLGGSGPQGCAAVLAALAVEEGAGWFFEVEVAGAQRWTPVFGQAR